MAWVTQSWEKLSVIPQQTDLNCFKAVKTRQPSHCAICNKKQPTGSWVYGSDWTRICLSCWEDFSNRAILSFQNVISYIKQNQRTYTTNKQKWNVENTLAKL